MVDVEVNVVASNVRNIDIEIEVQQTIVMIDPDLTANVETPNRPAVATPTSGPNRYTVFVPFDHSTLSLGQSGPAPDRVHDRGITGRTDQHVHFHVADQNKTLVSLGGPATDAGGFSSAVDGEIPIGRCGYTMLTEQVAWQESKLLHCVVSTHGDTHVGTMGQGKLAALAAINGSVEVLGRDSAAVVSQKQLALAAVSHLPENVNHGYEFGKAVSKEITSKIGKTVMGAIDAASIAYTAFTAHAGSTHHTKEHDPGEEHSAAWEKAHMAADVAKFLSLIGRAANDWFGGGPSFAGYGTTGAGLMSPIQTYMYAHLSSSINSALSASVVGTYATVRGALWTILSGTREICVKSLKEVKIESDRGVVIIASKKNTSINSEEHAVHVQGKTNARLNAKDGFAVVHGEKGVYVGAGEKFGIKADDKGIDMGKIASNGKKFDGSTTIDPKATVAVSASKVHMIHGDAMVLLANDSISLMAKRAYGYKVDASGNIDVKGSKILLG